MKAKSLFIFRLGVMVASAVVAMRAAAAEEVVALPQGVKAVWELGKAFRETTPSRERVCLNGLWRWQPAHGDAATVPAERWGYFKVPGCWPGITDYMQKDCQTVFAHPGWQTEKMGRLAAAWYQREITIPDDWTGRRITLSAEYVNSCATVFVDGKPMGELRFPAGEVDLTAVCQPGKKYLLSLRVVALPLKAVMLSHSDTASTHEVEGAVARRGLCGDVFLEGTPPGARLADIQVATSTRQGTITFTTALQNLAGQGSYRLRARIMEQGRTVAEFTSPPGADARATLAARWQPDKLWDLHTPQNVFEAQLALLDADGKVLDVALPVRFGFREFWIEGRDFFLNGSRIFLAAVPFDAAQNGAAWASYAGAKESLLRLRSFGINFVYTHNYACEPGSHLGFAEILRAADDVGMLVAFTQPHFSDYDWTAPDAEENNGYARHAEFYVRAAGSHPAVVFYAMSHNATGYSEDMNPDLIDGRSEPRDTWSQKNARRALRAEAIVHRLDPGRIVYHHSSGNLGAMHTSNFYPNFAPVQELSDWFEHWATTGVKPVFTCEYGAPFTWDWTMYRGWYKGQRSFGNARVAWEFCFAEWNAQFLGDRAFQIGAAEQANLRWEAKQFRAGNVWHRWDYPFEVGSTAFDDRFEVFAQYLTDNWRAFRTWGVSAISPWEYGHFWKLRDGLNRNARQPLAVDWGKLQRPGFSPDYLAERYERMDLAYEPKDWVATPAARALLRNNRPLLAYLAGKPAHFTSKDHTFLAGETVEKQIIVINNSRMPVTCDCTWSLGDVSGRKTLAVPTGQQGRQPLRFDLPAALTPGAYELKLTAKFSTGEVQADAFTIHILPLLTPATVGARIAVFDPKGETWALLKRGQRVEADADLSAYDLLVIGKAALTVAGPQPDLRRVRQGLKVILFEQTAEVLEKHFGFRVAEYGLRQVMPRVPDHPVLAGLGAEQLRDWRGEATLLAPRLKYELNPRFNYVPTVKWCGLDVPRVWRCGCRGNVASVLIEKPARGDFLPLVDGGFSLQYSPLMEYHEGRGLVLFCQMDVTGRSESDPAADTLFQNLLRYAAAWQPAPQRKAFYLGDPAGRRHLEAAGFSLGVCENEKPGPDDVLVIGPGGAAAAGHWLQPGQPVLALGLEPAEAAALPCPVTMKRAEHIATFFAPPGRHSLLAGVGPADVHNRDPQELALVTGGATVFGDGVLAQAGKANIVFCQMVPWRFDYQKQYNLKRTYRRTAFLVTRLMANLGVASTVTLQGGGYYLDTPEGMDDPYRFFRW